MIEPHHVLAILKSSTNNTNMLSHQVTKTTKKSKEPRSTASKISKPNRKTINEESSHATAISTAITIEKPEKEENPTTSLIRKRPPLVTRLNTIEQNQFASRKATQQIITRGKTAWDYVLEEATWMSIDFRQELRWKLGFSKAASEACNEKLLTQQFERTYLFPEQTTEEKQHLQAIAKELSRLILLKWSTLQQQISAVIVPSTPPLVQTDSALELKEEPTERNPFPMDIDEKKDVVQVDTTLESLIEKVLSIPALIVEQQHLVPFPPTTPFITTNHFDYNYLLKHQQIICKDIYRLSRLGLGTIIYGSSYSGKTVALIYTLIGWFELQEQGSVARAVKEDPSLETKAFASEEVVEDGCTRPTVLIFGLQKCLLRWLFILQSTIGHCCEFVLCEEQSWTNLPLPAVLSIQSNRDTIPRIILIDVDDADSFFDLHYSKVQNLQGVIIDLRGYPIKIPSVPGQTSNQASLMDSPLVSGLGSNNNSNNSNGLSSSSAYNDRKNRILLHLSEILPATQKNRVIVTDENFRLIDRYSTLSFLLSGARLQSLLKKFQGAANNSFSQHSDIQGFSSPLKGTTTKEEQPHSPSLQLPQDASLKNTLNQLLINLSVHATIPSDLNTRAYAQIREEVISTELTPAQQRKYDEIALVLVKSGYYDGSDMDKFSRITTLMKMVCFHSQLVSIKRLPNVIYNNNNNNINNNNYNSGSQQHNDPPQYYFLSYRPSSSSVVTSSSSVSIMPSAYSHSITTGSNFSNSATNNTSTINHTSNFYTQSSIGSNNNFNSSSHFSNNSNNNTTNRITATNHSIYFSPGSLIYKINRHPSFFHSLNESYLSEGSNKLKILKALLHRFEGLRVVLVAGNWIELHLIHSYLSHHHIDHLYPHFYLKHGRHHVASTSPITAAVPPNDTAASGIPETFAEYFYQQDRFYWLGEENNIQLFNDPTVLSSILLTSLSAFKSPSMSPWLADAVILLSHEWDQYCEIRNCFRLRLLKAGPRGDPVTIIRVSSKNTIEEVMLKQKTGLPQLQGMKLIDLNLIQKNTHHPSSSSSHVVNTSFSGVNSALSGNNDGNFVNNTSTGEMDYSSGFITNITFLKSIPLMHIPNKNFNTALPATGSSTISNVYHHSTPVSPLGISTPLASFDIRGSPTVSVTEVESQNNSGSETNTIGGIPPRRGSGKGIIVIGPQGKTQFIKDSSTSGTGNLLSSSLAGWSTRSNLVAPFQDDTLVSYSSITPTHLSGGAATTASTRLNTPMVKIDKPAVQKWLDTYRQALYHNYIEFIHPLSSSLNSLQHTNLIEDPYYMTTSSSQASSQLEQKVQSLQKQFPYLIKIEKYIIHLIYVYFYQRYLRLSLSSSNPQLGDSLEESNSIYRERDYSHEISWYLSMFQTLAEQIEEKKMGKDRNRMMSTIERMRLLHYGYGKSEKESKLMKLLVPLVSVEHHPPINLPYIPAGGNGYSSALFSETMSVVSSSFNAVETLTNNGSIVQPQSSGLVHSAGSGANQGGPHHSRPPVYQHFQESLQEAMRLGLQIEPWLYSNPLQSATRYDYIHIPSYQHDLLIPEYSIKVKYMNANYVAPTTGTTLTVGSSNKSTSTSRRKNSNASANSGNAATNTNTADFNLMKESSDASVPMSYSSAGSMVAGSGVGGSDVPPMKRDIIGVISSSNTVPGSNMGMNSSRSLYAPSSQPLAGIYSTEGGMKRNYDNMSGYYPPPTSSTMPAIKDEGELYPDKRRKIDYSSVIYAYDRVHGTNPSGATSGNPSTSGIDNLGPYHQSSYSGVHPHATTTIGGMILPTTSTNNSSYGASASYLSSTTGSSNYNFDINQQKLLLSENNLTVTPNANLFTNNMIYEDNNNSNNNNNNNNSGLPPHHGSKPNIQSESTRGGVGGMYSNPTSYYNNSSISSNAVKISVGGYPIVDDQGGPNGNSNIPGSNKYPVKLPSIPIKTTSQTSQSLPSINNNNSNAGSSSGYIQPLHPAMTISGNPIPTSTVGGIPPSISAPARSSSSSLDEMKKLGSPAAPSYYSSHHGVASSPAPSSSYVMSHGKRDGGGGGGSGMGSNDLPSTDALSHGHNQVEDEKWMAVEDDILICMQNAIHDPNFSHTMHWLNNAKGIVLKTSRTVYQAKNRYSYLCSSGKKDERLLDPNVIRAIAKLKKSIKRPLVADPTDPNAATTGGEITDTATAQSSTTTPMPVTNPIASGNSTTATLPPPTPTIGMTHAIEKKTQN